MQIRSLKGLVGLVTGGAGTLGGATIQRLLAAECRVTCLDNANPKDYSQKFDASSEQLLLFNGSIVSDNDVNECLNAVRSRFGKLDFVVNCVFDTSIEKFTSKTQFQKDYLKSMLDNTVGIFNVCRLAVPLIAEKEVGDNEEAGVIVNVGSIFAYDGNNGQALYSSLKASVRAMTLPLARDLAQYKIRVVCVSPGLFQSKLLIGNSNEETPVYRYLSSLNLTQKGMLPPEGFAETIEEVICNPMLNGCNIRVDDGARVSLL